jgi:hypothetical protein
VLCDTGGVTSFTACHGTLCIAAASAERAVLTLPLDAPNAVHVRPLREARGVLAWVSDTVLGAASLPAVAAMATARPSEERSAEVLAVLYSSGLLSVWDPAAQRHLCQADLSRSGSGAAASAAAQPGTEMTGMCVRLTLDSAPCPPCTANM